MGAAGIWGGERKDAAQHPTKYRRTPSPSQTRTYVAHSVTSVQVESPDPQTVLRHTVNVSAQKGGSRAHSPLRTSAFSCTPVTRLQNLGLGVLVGPRSASFPFSALPMPLGVSSSPFPSPGAYALEKPRLPPVFQITFFVKFCPWKQGRDTVAVAVARTNCAAK